MAWDRVVNVADWVERNSVDRVAVSGWFRPAMLALGAGVLQAAAFGSAWLVLGGPLGNYEFARGAAPSSHDVLVARICVVGGFVLALAALASIAASVVLKASRVLWSLFVVQVFLAMPVYVFLLLGVWIIAFRDWSTAS